MHLTLRVCLQKAKKNGAAEESEEDEEDGDDEEEEPEEEEEEEEQPAAKKKRASKGGGSSSKKGSRGTEPAVRFACLDHALAPAGQLVSKQTMAAASCTLLLPIPDQGVHVHAA